MQVSREDLNPCTVKLDIVCEPGEVASGFETAFKQLTKKVTLPGFRPGKAPRALLERYVEEGEWNEHAAEEMVRKVYPKALEEEKLEIDRTTMPHVTINHIDKEEKKFEFSVKVPLPPKVELGEYKGLPVDQPSAEVTDEELDYELEGLRRKGQTHRPVTDRGVANGDVAVLNIKPESDDEEKTIVIIVGKTFPALDEAVLGMKVEEIKSLDLDFPEDFQQTEWAGKSLKVQVTLNSLSGVALPELDDSFAQSLKTQNVDDLRNRLREIIGRTKQQMVREMVHERLVDELMHRSQVSVSDNMWENLANRRIQELTEEQRSKGKSLRDYVEENGMSIDEFTKAWQEKAKLEVERALLVQSVYGKEQMEVDSSDLNRELMAMASEYQVAPQDLLEELRKNDSLEELHFRALSRKVGDFLLSNAEVTIKELSPAQIAETPELQAPSEEPEKETEQAEESATVAE